MVSWFKQQFGHPEVAAALSAGVPPEALFDRLVEQAPPGSDGLMLQPYWTPGVRTPGPEARGAVIGFTDAHTRAHLFRAILEGLAYALREGCERIEAQERRQGDEPSRLGRRLAVQRGDAGDRGRLQQAGVAAAHVRDVGLGAAIVGAVGLGLHPDYPTAVAAMTRLGPTFEPDPRRAALYDRLYRQVYTHMYRRLAPLYRDLQTTLRQEP